MFVLYPRDLKIRKSSAHLVSMRNQMSNVLIKKPVLPPQFTVWAISCVCVCVCGCVCACVCVCVTCGYLFYLVLLCCMCVLFDGLLRFNRTITSLYVTSGVSIWKKIMFCTRAGYHKKVRHHISSSSRPWYSVIRSEDKLQHKHITGETPLWSGHNKITEITGWESRGHGWMRLSCLEKKKSNLFLTAKTIQVCRDALFLSTTRYPFLLPHPQCVMLFFSFFFVLHMRVTSGPWPDAGVWYGSHLNNHVKSHAENIGSG